ncbi:hypothetical protein P691DRAFT_834470 [Macrolepiota fuliginosa MF-IS2]|uniref:Transmembrane protein n=1 Tax=Macrolepiota fuliginosa MF-IS2 TaxID=1400762 RepID=A0A9P6C0N4_9AGAR|nr:hypothetical protein P691DRAFT_834470 [Macrolepiota fuliginosa MF-IS2]
MTSQCLNIDECRITQDIVWSCVATILACIWVAVHPNLPGPRDSNWVIFKRRTVTMVYALLAPEFMAWWAVRQRVAAGSIAREFNEKFHNSTGLPEENIWTWMKEWIHGADEDAQSRGWTLTHGFFLQMGGFVLQHRGKPVSALTFKKLLALIEAGEVNVPTITEKEILDKSKGDLLTKLIVVLQTTWFVVQCLARWAGSLYVTELEVITLAFAALNVVTYFLWWQKPQSIRVGVPVELNAKKDMVHALQCRSCGNRLASVFILCQMPVTLLRGLLRPFYKMAGDVDIDIETGSARLPMFYAHNLGSQVLFVAIAFVFGGLHLVAWKTWFPSNPEKWLWRSCALFITIEPAVLLLYRKFWTHELNNFVDLVVMFSLTLYCLARLALVILSCMAFRALPQYAYQNVHWSSFFPHI